MVRSGLPIHNAQCDWDDNSQEPIFAGKPALLCGMTSLVASGCPATPQANSRSGDARNLTARRPFKSASASCGSKETFDFHLAFFALRLRKRKPCLLPSPPTAQFNHRVWMDVDH